jgi:hypothetical protein
MAKFIWINICDTFPSQNYLKKKDNTFQLSFRIKYYESPGKSGGTGIKWDVSASGLR